MLSGAECVARVLFFSARGTLVALRALCFFPSDTYFSKKKDDNEETFRTFKAIPKKAGGGGAD